MTIINYHDASRVAVISATKMASTSIREFYGYNQYSHIHLPCFNLDYIDGKWKAEIQDFNIDESVDNIPEQVINANDSFNKLINGKLSKDIIVVIRNPIKRFLSAFHEDYISPIKDLNVFKLFGGLLLNSKSIDMDKARLCEIKSHINNMDISLLNSQDSDINEDLINYLDRDTLNLIASILLKEYSIKKFPIWYNHNTPYHSTLLPFINDLNNNVIIVDIDEQNLSNQLNVYEDNPRLLKKLNKSTAMSNSLNYVFNERMNNEFILAELQNEILSYNILKSKIKN